MSGSALENVRQISSPGLPMRKPSNPFLIAGLEEIRSQQTGSAASSPVQARRQIFEPESARSGAEGSPVPTRLSFTLGKPSISNSSDTKSPRERTSISGALSPRDSISQNSKLSSDLISRRGPSALLRLLEKAASALPPPTGREADSTEAKETTSSFESNLELKLEPQSATDSAPGPLPPSGGSPNSESENTDTKSQDSLISDEKSGPPSPIVTPSSDASNMLESSKNNDHNKIEDNDDDVPPPAPADSSSDSDDDSPPPPPEDSEGSQSSDSDSESSEPPEVPSLPPATPQTPSAVPALPLTPSSARIPSFKRQSQMILNTFFDDLEKGTESSEDDKNVPVPLLELPVKPQNDKNDSMMDEKLSQRSTESSDDGIVEVSVARAVRAETSEDDSTIDSSEEVPERKETLRRKPSVGVLMRSPSAKLSASPVLFRRVPVTPKSKHNSSDSSSVSGSDDESDESPPPAYDATVALSLSGSPGTSNPFPQDVLLDKDNDANSLEMERIVSGAHGVFSLDEPDGGMPPPSYRTALDIDMNEESSEPATPRGERVLPEHDEELKRNILSLQLPEDIIRDVMSMDPEARANWFRSIDTVRDFPEPPPLTAHSPHPARHLIKARGAQPRDEDLESSGSSVERIVSPKEIRFDPLADDTPRDERRFGPPRVMPSSIELGTRIANSLGATDVRMFGPVRATRGMFMSKDFKRYAKLKNKDKGT
jgi:hypothetical protein